MTLQEHIKTSLNAVNERFEDWSKMVDDITYVDDDYIGIRCHKGITINNQDWIQWLYSKCTDHGTKEIWLDGGDVIIDLVKPLDFYGMTFHGDARFIIKGTKELANLSFEVKYIKFTSDFKVKNCHLDAKKLELNDQSLVIPPFLTSYVTTVLIPNTRPALVGLEHFIMGNISHPNVQEIKFMQ